VASLRDVSGKRTHVAKMLLADNAAAASTGT
jgi:hypothetical protein